MHRLLLLTAALLALPAVAPFAADEEDKAPAKPLPEERQVSTRNNVRIGDASVDYTATAGTLHIAGEDGEPAAAMFYMAYTRAGVGNTDRRPVMFTFNGGPGSSSVWLHLGTFGPRRVAFPDAEHPPAAPYALEDNTHSLLDVTDLVFIDPVGTGYSTALGEAEDDDFHSVEQDVESVGEFIRLWTARNGRWNSPKLVAGESYGSTRAAALAEHLQDKGIFVNGVVLVSSILNFQTARFETGNDLPYITFLPTYAATAWYHDALPERAAELEPWLDEVRDFAAGDYASALMKGSALPADEEAAIARRLAAYTGLSVDYLRETNLRPSIFRFTKELLRDRRRTVGRLDSRYLGMDADSAGERFEHDPSMTAIMGPYTAALNHYVRSELGYEEDREYQVLSFAVNQGWDWDTDRAGYLNVAENLRQAMAADPHLEVFVANGYYDLATPFFATEYTMDHLGLEPELRDNITMAYYPAGHMMYVHPGSLQQLKADLAAFIRSLQR